MVHSHVQYTLQCRLALVLPLWEGKAEKTYEVLEVAPSQEVNGEWMYQLQAKV